MAPELVYPWHIAAREGVLLVMTKFNQILDIDADARTAGVEPGVRNLAISEAVSHLDLTYAPTHRPDSCRLVEILPRIPAGSTASNMD